MSSLILSLSNASSALSGPSWGALGGLFGASRGAHRAAAGPSRATMPQWRGRGGIVFASRGPGQVGHVFNAVVNKRGVVKFIDGQTGSAATLGGFKTFQFLPTN